MRFVAAAGALCALVVLGAGLLAGSAGSNTHRGPAGIVPIFTKASHARSTRCSGNSTCTPLHYHGGPVMHTNKNYVIFWKPNGYTSWDGGAPYSTNYKSLISRFFTDLAAASGATSNVYGALTELCDGPSGSGNGATSCAGQPANNFITTNSTFGGTVDDTQPYPASACTDPEGLTSICLRDDQIAAEIQNVINAQGWTKNATTQFFLFLPRGTTTCFDNGGINGVCSYNYFCAYHNNVGNGSNALIYGNMPYPVHNGFDLCEDSASPQYPNADAPADIVLSTTSHESNEAISDPEPNSAWWDQFDNTGGENGDKCAYYYGSPQGTNGSEFNQTINGNHYYLQLEWGQTESDCVASTSGGGGGGGGGPVAIITKTSPKSGVVGQSISISGKNLTGVTGIKINGTAMTNVGPGNGKKDTATIAPGTTSGSLVVTNGGGDSNALAFTVNPSPLPVVKSVPKSGHVGSTVKIGGKNFYGASSVLINGTACTAITVSSATKLTCTVGGGTTSGTVSVTTPGGTGVSTKTITIS